MRIKTTDRFDKEIKKLQKRFKNIDYDFENLLNQLLQNPKMGISLGKGFYKIRLKNSDIKRGKSSGYRVITYFIDEKEVVNLISIYYKGDKDTITAEEILEIARESGII